MARNRQCPRVLREFGADLKRWLYDKKSGWKLMPEHYSTWLEGGCWLLARALHDWMGKDAELWVIYSKADSEFFRGMMPQHVVVKVWDCYLDGDGASSEVELLRRWRDEEGLRDPELRPVDPQALGEVGIECPAAALKDLRNALAWEFGPR